MSKRPDAIFDEMTPHERTALAWERTAIASMVAGVILARYATELHRAFAIVGVAQVVFGACLLVWASTRYDQLHEPLRQGAATVHPTAARIVGLAAVIFTGAATIISIGVVLARN